MVVAFSVGTAIVLGVLRILKGWPIHRLIIGGYVLVTVMTAFAPDEIIGVAYDSGGVTTSTITVPLVTALGVVTRDVDQGAQPHDRRLRAHRVREPHADDLRARLRHGGVNMEFVSHVAAVAFSTALDVAPIVGILVRVPGWRCSAAGRRTFAGSWPGFVCVLLGLTLFLIGLEEALFPIGETMARQLTDPQTIGAVGLVDGVHWHDYLLVYAFAATIGFATTVAEPSLIAVALKAQEVSGGAVRAWGLRIAVALGVAAGRGPRLFPDRHRHAVALVHHHGLRGGDLPRRSAPAAPSCRSPTTAAGSPRRRSRLPVVAAVGIGAGRQRSRAQSTHRWVRPHRLCPASSPSCPSWAIPWP